MSMLRKTLLTGAALALAGLALAANEPPKMTPEQQAEMDAMMKAGTPGAQHKFLASTAGDYTVKVKSWEAANGPPTEESGTATRAMTLDGRVLVEDMKWSFAGQPVTGHGMVGYDNVTGKYWSTWNDSMSTGIAMSEGTCDAKNTCKYTGHYNDPVKKKPATAHFVSHWPNPTTEVFEMHGPGKDGKEYKMMELTYTKK
jgi:hypothetical protein